ISQLKHVPIKQLLHIAKTPTYAISASGTATTKIYTLSLHDALPICRRRVPRSRRGAARPGRPAARGRAGRAGPPCRWGCAEWRRDRKSTRLNSSHVKISYAVFCLKKKKEEKQ